MNKFTLLRGINMKKFAWITDSTCGLSAQFIKEHNIYVLPLSVIINGVSYKEDIDITKEQVYEKLQEHGEGATTSQPSFGEFIDLYEELKEQYDCGIAIHASKALTGQYESSIIASDKRGLPVDVYDSQIGAYELGKMIKNGIELEEQGKTYEEIVAKIRTYPNQAEMFLLPSSFEQMKRSGRVSTPQAVFASLLSINLILGFDDGAVVVKEKIRTKKRAERRFCRIISDAVEKYQLNEICVMHAGVIDRAHKWKEEIEDMHEQLKVKIETLVPVAGVHAGHGTMSVAWLKTK